MNERLKNFLGKFIELRSPQEIAASKGRLQSEFRVLVSQYASGQIPLSEFRDRYELHYQNPDAHFDRRKMAEKLEMP